MEVLRWHEKAEAGDGRARLGQWGTYLRTGRWWHGFGLGLGFGTGLVNAI
jgi:hypothetical protein